MYAVSRVNFGSCQSLASRFLAVLMLMDPCSTDHMLCQPSCFFRHQLIDVIVAARGGREVTALSKLATVHFMNPYLACRLTFPQ